MNEKAPSVTSSFEKNPDRNLNESLPAHSVEEVAAQVHTAHEVWHSNPSASTKDPEMLHTLVHDTELGDMYECIQAHEGVVFGDITTSVEKARRLAEAVKSDYLDSEWQEIDKRLRLLAFRDSEIRRATRSYVLTLSQFFNIMHRRDSLDAEEFKDRLETIDRRRRTAHNGLLEALSVYVGTLKWLHDEGVLEKAVLFDWQPGKVMPKTENNEKVLYIFSDAFISDRDLVRKWAVSVNLHDQIEEIQKIKKENGHAL